MFRLLSKSPRHYIKTVEQRLAFTAPAVQPFVEFQQGDKLHGFTVDKVEAVPEFHMTAVRLTHDKTGAQHLHFARDDSNNVFSVSFRTTPLDHTGVPHILEHTALCGSDKFPVRDPFFKMLNRSLSTFMNAMTASDWTMYPFSTQNPQDFENLLSVYLDSAFKPRLRELDFAQEGWRLEHEDPNDPHSPIVYKGVVFNEMKGVFSNSQNIFSQAVQNLLLPSHTYSVVYGGDPQHITDLTHEQLKEFHETHYHPSNARFFTYGDFPMERHLKLIDSLCLNKFSMVTMDTSVPLEVRWPSPRIEHISCRPDPMAADPGKQTTVAVSFLLSDITDTYESFTLSVLSALLVDGPTSPFYQSLLESNIGSDYAPVLGYDGNTREATFSIGLQGISKNDVDMVLQRIQDTFHSVIKNGIERERIDALLHRIELSQKHQTSNFGLGLIMGVASMCNHGGNVIECLQVNKHVMRLKGDLQSNPRFLQDKVEQYFKKNNHRLTLIMSPEDDFDEKMTHKEREKLAKTVDALSPEERTLVFKRGKELLRKQMEEEDVSCLPSLKVSDIEKTVKLETVDQMYYDKVPIQLNEQPTNGVTYFRALANINTLPVELQQYIPLFCTVCTRMGAGAMDFKELAHQVELKTGGLSATPHVHENNSNLESFELGVLLSSYCLDTNVDDMYHLWSEIFNHLYLTDHNRLQTLIQMTAADMASSLSDSGHSFAMAHASSHVHPAYRLKELFGGVTQVSVMKKIAEMEDLSPVVNHLKEIGEHVLRKDNLRCALSTGHDAMETVVKATEALLSAIPGSWQQNACFLKDPDFKLTSHKTQIQLPFSVNYVAKSIQTVPYTHKDFAKLRILGRLLTNKFLHREIREKGGAYGGGAQSGSPGVFSFFSYRDPHSTDTLDVFERSSEWAMKGDFSQSDVDEATLAVFQKVDAPVAPGNRGMRLFLNHITDDQKQCHREQLMAVSREDVTHVAGKYLINCYPKSAATFLGPENKEIISDKSWTVKRE